MLPLPASIRVGGGKIEELIEAEVIGYQEILRRQISTLEKEKKR